MGLLEKLIPPAGPDRFAQKLMRAIRARGVTDSLTYDADDFMIQIGRGDHRLFLQNAYADYRAASFAGRAKVITTYAGLARADDTKVNSFDDARGKLLPKLRERYYYESFKLVQQSQGLATDPPAELQLFSNDLTLELIIDFPEVVKSVPPKQFVEWGITFDEALKVARDNLWAISNKPFVQVQPGLHVSEFQDTHDASRLFLHDLIWQLPVDGEHVAIAPERNLLIVTGSNDEEGLVRMAEIAFDVIQKAHRRMSGIAVRLDGSKWVPFIAPDGSRADHALRRPRMLAETVQYEEQKALLEKVHERSERDIYVASHKLMERDDGCFWSHTFWVADTTDALIPRGDFIAMCNPDKTHSFARWDDVMRVAGDLLQPTEYYPPRWRVRAYPSEPQLAQIERFDGDAVASGRVT